MTSKIEQPSGLNLSEVSFHPAPTLRCKGKRFVSGLWYYLLLLAFVVGLPAATCIVIERAQHFFAH
jgi:hypothetical protein